MPPRLRRRHSAALRPFRRSAGRAGLAAMEDADYFEGSAAEWGSEADGGAVSAGGQRGEG